MSHQPAVPTQRAAEAAQQNAAQPNAAQQNASEVAVESAAATPAASASAAAAVRVLLVDDDPAVLRVTAGILRALGYGVSAFSSARDALRHLQEQPVDVVVSDILMPDVDGFELTQQLRRAPGRVPVVLVSGGGGRVGLGDVSGIGALLADQFLKKPYSAAELRSAIDSALSAGRARGG